MREITADTETWLAGRYLLLERSHDFYLQMTRSRETFDPDTIHDLRVSSRRLREGLDIFGYCFQKRRILAVRRELKRLITMLGSIRNTDEALLFFISLSEKHPEISGALVMNIIAVLQARRVTEQRSLRRELKRTDPKLLLSRIDTICKNPRLFKPNANSLFRPVSATLLEAVAAREKPMLSLLSDALIYANAAAQHRLRISVKRFRYRVEYLAPLASGNYRPVYGVIKEFQEVLGHLHDLDVFLDLAEEMLSGQPGKGSITNSIADCRRGLFDTFLQLQRATPLDELAGRVRGLL